MAPAQRSVAHARPSAGKRVTASSWPSEASAVPLVSISLLPRRDPPGDRRPAHALPPAVLHFHDDRHVARGPFGNLQQWANPPAPHPPLPHPLHLPTPPHPPHPSRDHP